MENEQFFLLLRVINIIENIERVNSIKTMVMNEFFDELTLKQKKSLKQEFPDHFPKTTPM